jgi:Leucine-rich repeat (LRR) protein
VEALDLSASSMSDACMRYLSQLKQLTTLFLQNTGITDAAVEYFAELPSLRYLDVRGTQMSTTWHSALPGVQIFGNERVD